MRFWKQQALDMKRERNEERSRADVAEQSYRHAVSAVSENIASRLAAERYARGLAETNTALQGELRASGQRVCAVEAIAVQMRDEWLAQAVLVCATGPDQTRSLDGYTCGPNTRLVAYVKQPKPEPKPWFEWDVSLQSYEPTYIKQPADAFYWWPRGFHWDGQRWVK